MYLVDCYDQNSDFFVLLAFPVSRHEASCGIILPSGTLVEFPGELGVTAILDCVLHRAISRGNSYWLNDKLKAGLIRTAEPAAVNNE